MYLFVIYRRTTYNMQFFKWENIRFEYYKLSFEKIWINEFNPIVDFQNEIYRNWLIFSILLQNNVFNFFFSPTLIRFSYHQSHISCTIVCWIFEALMKIEFQHLVDFFSQKYCINNINIRSIRFIYF